MRCIIGGRSSAYDIMEAENMDTQRARNGYGAHSADTERNMSIYSITHISLRVTNLQEAEAYYCDLFGLEVAWREAETIDGWRRLPEGKTWHDAEVAGIQLGIAMLHRDGLALALEPHALISTEGQLSHIGLLVDEQELNRLRHYAPQVGGRLVHDD